MDAHPPLTDSEFEEQFSNCTLDPSSFDHKAHIRLAWILISRFGEEKAGEIACSQIRNFAIANGAKEKFNKTVTVAAVKAVHHFMLRSESTDFESFINENPRLVHSFKELLGHHYSADIFRSEQARMKYLEPDLLPFD